MAHATSLSVLYYHVTEAEVASGPYTRSTLLIPKATHVSQEMKFTFTCKQFPGKAAFALTCDKAQGQTSEQIVICFPTQFLSHGQLYVVLSRVRKKDNVKILAERNRNSIITDNCIYKELLR
ncbi:uncharacterized protein LOC106881442 [Octopus bimaculoides]|uniref:uncharacterized protein LOC106881442 n=1 Tax=Octopus bimaculoides TaxID=37653 RepID=UPI00071E5D44|nr:uncharacterized protein LOC106881442 [Octopus bimaculoides]|eukprot:XP_014787313.1 PREDICTED: uncharacterized protein LOC106881442 [Octopus bimaculoides]